MGKGKRLRQTRVATSVTISQRSGISERWFYIIRYIAIVTMFIDHLGEVLFLTRQIGTNLYIACYVIGRIAFPLFAFELVESFYVTKNRKKHLLRLGLLALVSELPFDMVGALPVPTTFSEDAMRQQNVCFTLFFGFLLLMIVDMVDSKIYKLLHKHRYTGQAVSATVSVMLTIAFGFVADVTSTDYSWYGIVLIVLFAFARNTTERWKSQSSDAFQQTSLYIKQGVTMLWFAVSYGVSPIVFIPLGVSLALIYIAEIRSTKVVENKPTALVSNAAKCFCRAFYPLHLALLGTLRALLMGWTI